MVIVKIDIWNICELEKNKVRLEVFFYLFIEIFSFIF